MAEREGKGKAETWACKPVMEDKGRLCSTLLKPSMNKRLITVWSFSYETGFICSHHTSHRTKLLLFLQTSCSWCSDGNPYSRRDFFLPLKEIMTLLKHTETHSGRVRTNLGSSQLCPETKKQIKYFFTKVSLVGHIGYPATLGRVR